MADRSKGTDASGRPAEGADWIEAAGESFERWRTARDMAALSRAAAILNGAAPRMVMDPERTGLAAGIGEALLDVSVRQQRPDVLDFAISLLQREMEFIDGMLDPSGAALVAGRLATLLSERFYLSRRLEDLAAALALYDGNATFVDAVPDALEDRDRAMFWWGFGKAHQLKADIAKQRAELVAATECLEKAAAALDTASAFGRQVRGDLAIAQLELLQTEGARKDPTPEYRARLDSTVAILRSLSEGVVTEIDRRRWLQNLATVLRQRAEIWPAGDRRRQDDLREALGATERGLESRGGAGRNR